MPTGYTAYIEDGSITEAKDFILKCARGFGAFIHMRDKGLNMEAEYRKEYDYYPKQLEKTEADYQAYLKMTDEDIQNNIEKKYEDEVQSKQQSYQKHLLEKERYMDMLGKIQNWNPPTFEHKNLKKFCLEQLEGSLRFDCLSMREYYNTPVKKLTVEEYRRNAEQNYSYNIDYYSKKIADDKKNVAEINKWIKDLVDSLN